jgi:hypothetical protein
VCYRHVQGPGGHTLVLIESCWVSLEDDRLMPELLGDQRRELLLFAIVYEGLCLPNINSAGETPMVS